MFALLLLSLALAMDAFAVSLVRGAAGKGRKIDALILGSAFGLAQGLMPLVGWLLGVAFAETFRSIDHWIAFALLTVLGLRMIREARSKETETVARGPLSSLSLLVAAFATSIDAAAGVALPLLGVPIPVACLVIGGVTGVLCASGYVAGARIGTKLGKKAELAGGIALISLGMKILIEHLSA
jgi:putative Mn2+ efflux pump MntP